MLNTAKNIVDVQNPDRLKQAPPKSRYLNARLGWNIVKSLYNIKMLIKLHDLMLLSSVFR
jgi:hypothetical protein